jgi:hypothetical protein
MMFERNYTNLKYVSKQLCLLKIVVDSIESRSTTRFRDEAVKYD